ncbi:hypothetical protein H7I57_24980 [Mycobacterium pyrenivorans]|nr:hypothetical protein [Mycolicibacterium pyrenivorans]
MTAPADHIPRYTDIRSPSGNIGCLLTPTGVGCNIRERDWSPPPRPANCRLEYARIAVSRGGPAHFVCAGDTVLDPGAEPLAYGEKVIVGVMRCESAESGITCRDDESGHGFTISRESYNLF